MYVKSSIWPGIKRKIYTVMSNAIWEIGDGSGINFWLNNWYNDPLVDLLDFPVNLHKDLQATVADFIDNGKWVVPNYLLNKLSSAGVDLTKVPMPNYAAPDNLIWRNSNSSQLTFKDVVMFYKPASTQVSWSKLLCNEAIPPSKSFITWRLIYNRLSTDDNMQKSGCTTVSICCLNYPKLETIDHFSSTALLP